MNMIVALNLAVIWIILSCNLVVVFAIIRQQKGGKIDQLRPNEPAPDFEATALDGETMTLSTFRGRSLALLFIGTQCIHCRTGIPRYNELYPKALRLGVTLVLVSADGVEETKAFVSEMNTSLPVLVADRTSNSFLKDYKVIGTPSYCLIDERGRIQATGHPSEENPAWRKLVATWESKPETTGALQLKEGLS